MSINGTANIEQLLSNQLSKLDRFRELEKRFNLSDDLVYRRLSKLNEELNLQPKMVKLDKFIGVGKNVFNYRMIQITSVYVRLTPGSNVMKLSETHS